MESVISDATVKGGCYYSVCSGFMIYDWFDKRRTIISVHPYCFIEPIGKQFIESGPYRLLIDKRSVWQSLASV